MKSIRHQTKNKRADNLNSIASTKYGYLPEKIEVKSLKDDKFREINDFYRLVKVKQNAERNEKKRDPTKEKVERTFECWRKSSTFI